MASPGPMTDVDGLRNSSGSFGASPGQALHLRDVVGVVLADAHHLAGQDRREQPDVGLLVAGAGEGDLAERVALDLGHLAVSVEDAEGHALGGGETDDAHDPRLVGPLPAYRATMACRFSELVVNSRDPEALAAFWAAVLDYRVLGREDDGSRRDRPRPRASAARRPRWSSARSPTRRPGKLPAAHRRQPHRPRPGRRAAAAARPGRRPAPTSARPARRAGTCSPTPRATSSACCKRRLDPL